jgi:hypothetical protein
MEEMGSSAKDLRFMVAFETKALAQMNLSDALLQRC